MIYITTNISSFFYYIKFPYNTSQTLIKKCFLSCLKYKNKINYKLIKNICTKLNLEWKSELYLLRRNLKLWIKNNVVSFNIKYKKMHITNSVNIIKIIKILYFAFLLKKHTIDYYDIHNILDEYKVNYKNDVYLLTKMTNN